MFFKRPFLLTTFILLAHFCGIAQTNSPIKGRIVNGFTKEPIAFSSVRWLLQKTGNISDSLGQFTITNSNFSNDTLIIDYVGYDQKRISKKDLRIENLIINLEDLHSNEQVLVKSRFNKGLRWWKSIVTNKNLNNPYHIPSYGCEIYKKIELDLNNVNKNSFNNIKFLKPFAFVLDNIDSITDEKPFLPILMTEALSNYYYISNPNDSREVIKAQKAYGIRNESILQIVNGFEQKINIYDNYIKIFSKEFISPISDFADKFYNFKGADTQYIKGTKVFHLLFSPLREGENTFIGDAWIDASSWAIRKINLNISATADVNFVNRLNIVQEFEKQENGKLIFSKDKLTADLSPLPNDKLTFVIRKSNSYQNFNIEEESIKLEIAKNKKKNEVILLDNNNNNNASFWDDSRHEQLNNNEQNILKTIDTLKKLPLFKEYSRNIEFIVDGHRKIGKFEIGPWYKWISGNKYENTRLRFDIGTNELFSKYLRLSGYLAYGTEDQQFKEKLSIQYRFKKQKGLSTEFSYLNDLDNGRVRFNEEDITIDNIFSQILRRPGIPQKFLGQKEYKFLFTKEWESGLSNTLTFTRESFEPFTPLPNKREFITSKKTEIISSDIMYRIRYAPGEKKVMTNRRPIRFKGSKPIFELRISKGINGIFQSAYDFTKVHAAISQKIRVPNFGLITYNGYAGKIYGDSLPFMLLELHPGNEVFVYNRNGFNLMNRFEYYSDTYAGFQVEHNFEKKLINLIPFLRKTKIRQFWTLKGVWGVMNSTNRAFNRIELGPYQLRSLKNHTYLEYGTGFDNIFRFFRIDFVWRVAPPYPANFTPSRIQPIQNFGVFGSLKVQF